MMGTEFVAFSLPPILIAIFVALSCALPGNFLVLRKQALLGDAISHVILPGIVLGFMVTGAAQSLTMILGAAAAAILAVTLIEFIRRVSKIESGAAMGIVFTAMFASGVLLIERGAGSNVHLDVEHALYGNLESLIWLDATGWSSLLDPAALAGLPHELPTMAVTLLIVIAFLRIFWRPLTIATFDEDFADGLGLRSRLINFALIVLCALAAVAAFSAVGSIIVIAMFICPPAAARLMTHHLPSQMAWSAIFASISAIFGYVVAGYGPIWIGASSSVNAAGMIATINGLILAFAVIAAPKSHSA